MAESSPERSACYAFGDVVLDVARRRITRHGEIIALGRRGFKEPELAVDLMRKAFLGPGYAGFFLIWHAELSEARQTESFKRLAEDLGFVELWRTTGNWGDFCAPAGVHDFECV